MITQSGLDFPVLKIVKIDGETSITSKSGETEYGLYTLDWQEFDRKIQKDHISWSEEHWGGKIPFVTSLPSDLDKKLKDVIFMIDREYLTEIKRMSYMAAMEWDLGSRWSFDTSIREKCLDPAQKYIECMFTLISDFVYDRNTKEYADHERWIRCLLLYKFWRYQTGDGLVWRKAEMDWLMNSKEEKDKEIVDKIKQQAKLREDSRRVQWKIVKNGKEINIKEKK